LRDARLAEARRALQQAGSGQSITDIAMSWGFSHLGRFAIAYRRRFGETPRATLAATNRGGGKSSDFPDRAGCWELNPRLVPTSLDPRYDRSG
jgi:AraC-like DNA-binding protein